MARSMSVSEDPVADDTDNSTAGDAIKPWRVKVGKKKPHRVSMVHSGTSERAAGFMDKKNSGKFGGWSRRYFIAHGHYISYYKDDATLKDLLCAVDLRQIEISDPAGEGNRELTITYVQDETQAQILRTASPEECLTWVKCLRALKRIDFERGCPNGPDEDPSSAISAALGSAAGALAEAAAGDDDMASIFDETPSEDIAEAVEEAVEDDKKAKKKKRGSLEIVKDALFGSKKKGGSEDGDSEESDLVDADQDEAAAQKAAEKEAAKAEKEATKKAAADKKAADKAEKEAAKKVAAEKKAAGKAEKDAAKKIEAEKKAAEKVEKEAAKKKAKEEQAAIKEMAKTEKTLPDAEKEARANASTKLQAIERGRSLRKSIEIVDDGGENNVDEEDANNVDEEDENKQE